MFNVGTSAKKKKKKKNKSEFGKKNWSPSK